MCVCVCVCVNIQLIFSQIRRLPAGLIVPVDTGTHQNWRLFLPPLPSTFAFFTAPPQRCQGSLGVLKLMNHLRYLELSGNPLAEETGYRLLVIKNIPWLETLDMHAVIAKHLAPGGLKQRVSLEVCSENDCAACKGKCDRESWSTEKHGGW